MIEQMPELSDWTLKVVGFGNYEAQYKKLAKGLRLERIFLKAGKILDHTIEKVLYL